MPASDASEAPSPASRVRRHTVARASATLASDTAAAMPAQMPTSSFRCEITMSAPTATLLPSWESQARVGRPLGKTRHGSGPPRLAQKGDVSKATWVAKANGEGRLHTRLVSAAHARLASIAAPGSSVMQTSATASVLPCSKCACNVLGEDASDTEAAPPHTALESLAGSTAKNSVLQDKGTGASGKRELQLKPSAASAAAGSKSNAQSHRAASAGNEPSGKACVTRETHMRPHGCDQADDSVEVAAPMNPTTVTSQRLTSRHSECSAPAALRDPSSALHASDAAATAHPSARNGCGCTSPSSTRHWRRSLSRSRAPPVPSTAFRIAAAASLLGLLASAQ
mmetsp:Transcript_572/g.2298  ORF Transcript_572/g.2298 Transcript_572/m.2298 type:complete len:340 (+) Transcript_572:763-1782(+)